MTNESFGFRRQRVASQMLPSPVSEGQPTDADFQKVGELCWRRPRPGRKENEFAGVEPTFMGLQTSLHTVLFWAS